MKKDWDNNIVYASDEDESMEIGYNRKAVKGRRDDIPEVFRDYLGKRPYDSERPEWKDGFVPTNIVDPTDPSETVVLTDLSHLEIWEYFAKMAEVMTFNSFLNLIHGEYAKLKYAVDEITKGVRIRSHIPDYPEESEYVNDYIGLLKELQYVTSILWHRRTDRTDRTDRSDRNDNPDHPNRKERKDRKEHNPPKKTKGSSGD